jgi:hypothetical protein
VKTGAVAACIVRLIGVSSGVFGNARQCRSPQVRPLQRGTITRSP